MKKYSFNNFLDTVDEMENKYNSSMSTPVENALHKMNNSYLAIMKRKTSKDVDIEALEMIIEMATLAKKHLEEIKG